MTCDKDRLVTELVGAWAEEGRLACRVATTPEANDETLFALEAVAVRTKEELLALLLQVEEAAYDKAIQECLGEASACATHHRSLSLLGFKKATLRIHQVGESIAKVCAHRISRLKQERP